MALNLRDIVNDPSVENVTAEWKDVGVELEISKSKLDEIECDYRYHVSDRKLEMFQYWLDNFRNPSLEDLHLAIQRVKERRERAENRNQAESEKRTVIGAIEHLEDFIEQFKKRNDEVKRDLTKYEDELQSETQWLQESSAGKNDWQNEELDETERDIQDALSSPNLKENEFAREHLLQKYGQDVNQMHEKEIEGYLRQSLIDLEMEKSKSVKRLYKDARKRLHRLTCLKTEVEQLKKILDERLRAYDEICQRLVKLGVSADAVILRDLNLQKETLLSISSKCARVYADSERVYELGKRRVKTYRNGLDVLLGSFKKSLHKFNTILKGMGKLILMLVVAGAVRAIAAIITIPVNILYFGIAAVRSAIGYRSHDDQTTSEHMRCARGAAQPTAAQVDTEQLSRSQANFKEHYKQAEMEYKDIQLLLQPWPDID